MAALTWISLPPYYSFRGPGYLLPVICVWFWYKFIFTAYVIEIGGDGSITFKSIFKSTSFSPDDVLWIRESIGFLTIKLVKGRVSATTMISHIHNFKKHLLTMNQNIEQKYVYYRGGAWK